MSKKKPADKALVPWVPDLPADVADAMEDLGHVLESSRSENTRLAYESDVKKWEEFAATSGLSRFPVSPGGLITWLMVLRKEGKSISTLRRRCAALNRWHEMQGHASPTTDPQVKEVLRGLSRLMNAKPDKKKAITAAQLQAAVGKLDLEHPKGLRDRAILLVGYATGMRRSEIAALQWNHVEFEPDGIAIYVAKSKTDQEGHGVWIGIPVVEDLGVMCPVAALSEWRQASLDPENPESLLVFRCTGKTVANVVKKALESIGENPAEYGAHSLRSGFATEARRSGADLDEIMSQTRHTSERVARGYIQRVDAIRNRAAIKALGRLKPKKETE